jgi:hypothetical protein
VNRIEKNPDFSGCFWLPAETSARAVSADFIEKITGFGGGRREARTRGLRIANAEVLRLFLNDLAGFPEIVNTT